jgi:hypothetical protein
MVLRLEKVDELVVALENELLLEGEEVGEEVAVLALVLLVLEAFDV